MLKPDFKLLMMELNSKIKYIVLEIICLLYVFLFIYAAISKLLDFENFKIQIGQSPLLSAFADWFAILVPADEILVCVLLLIPKFRLVGLYLAYGLMVMFTIYIFIILHYTSFIPCSCGGVLEKLNWKEHLIFNIVFILLAVIAIFISFSISQIKIKTRTKVVLFSIITLCGSLIVIILFLLSENIIHYHNKLIRRFPHTPVHKIISLDLKLNSYYFAGIDNERIYLGNTTAPLLVSTIDNKMQFQNKQMINLENRDLPFKGVKVIIQAPYFFVVDGTVPCIYRGKIKDWKAILVKRGGEYFTTAQVLDSTAITVSTNSSFSGENILGIIRFGRYPKTILNPLILQKQFDGVFDTDGQLLYSNDMKKIIFLYAYRNQFTVVDHTLNINFRGNTIDTITIAKLSIVKDKKRHQRKFSKPPLFVNKSSTVYNNLLFVNSAIPGRYEEDQMWEEASIIDVYDLATNSYVLSFCLYNIHGKKVKSFIVHQDKLYALIGNHLIEYNLDKKITSKYINYSNKNLLAK